MTDRIRTLTVVLDHDYREDDDAALIVSAIKMVRGVDRVIPGAPVSAGDWLARDLAKRELRKQLLRVLEPELAARIAEAMQP